MAPLQSRKRKSDHIEEAATVSTPTGSPSKKPRITAAQKQALIDNLQLEITKRARELRANYAIQCAELRSRVERRIQRIPMALRKVTMGELLESHLASQQTTSKSSLAAISQHATQPKLTPAMSVSKTRALPAIPEALPVKPLSPARSTIPTPARKRKSNEINIASDKENEAIDSGPAYLPVAKNTKPAKNGPASRPVSHNIRPNSVLSPRSHNSRTLPRSPIKDFTATPSSPTKPSFIARPVSPLKPASPLKSAASAATSVISASIQGMVGHAKRSKATTALQLSRNASREKATVASALTRGNMGPPPRPQRTVSQASNHSVSSSTSASSTGTTVVKKGMRTLANGQGATSKPSTSAAKTALKKTTMGVSKKVVVAEPALGKRVLRKRN